MAPPVRVTQLQRGDRAGLEQLVRTRTTPQRLVERARIILASADGQGADAIAAIVGVSRPTVARWLDRYDAEGLRGLLADKPRPGRPKTMTPKREAALIERTLRTAPPDGGTQWSTRLMAKAVGVHQTTVSRIWRAHGVKPHRVKRFKVSTDPEFVAKLRDVVGLYLDPPKRAVVFSVDEKSQIQALNRTQPGLPMKKGRAGTMTHDYERHGTTTLFAALHIATGHIHHDCLPRHRRHEFLRFMTGMERTVPKGLSIHVILDNYATHKTAEVATWLRRHPRVHFHFIPTSASWLNLVERFFSELTTRQLRRLAVTSVAELEAAIDGYIAQRNTAPTPFTWTASVRSILTKVAKANATLASLH